MDARPDFGAALGPEVAGLWYPAEADALAAELDGMLEAARPGPAPGEAGGGLLIAPHAGYRYSGAVAAAGFAALGGARPRRVWLLGPSHRASFEGAVAPRASRYVTPLGAVEIDREALGALAREPGVTEDDAPFHGEHSLEAEIPFLQRVLGDGWRLAPLLLGRAGPPEHLDRLAAALARRSGPDTICVVSSDFTHFGRHFGFEPFRDRVPERIEALDRGAIERIVAGDAEGFERYVDETGATICGRHPIRLVLRAFAGRPGRLAAYDRSGSMNGDWSHSVSYASVWFPPGSVRDRGSR